jgi:PAS domain S-box-containing protein
MDPSDLLALKTLSLLYVEDDTATREELAMILEPWVRELHVAADGQTGLDLFKQKRPDLVVTDIQMPRLSGLAMGGEIRRLVPGQPIVVLSAYNDVDYLFRAIELGIDQYITKPVNVERLLHKLANTGRVIQTQKELKRNQVVLEQYKMLVDESAIVYRLDTAGCITYVNTRMCDISGFSTQELLGLHFSELRAADDAEQKDTSYFERAKAGSKWTGILFNRTSAGGRYVVESSLIPIRNEVGHVLEIVALDVDITTLYRQYESLLDELNKSAASMEEQRHTLGEYKHALEQGNCICVVDHEYHISNVNEPFERLLGYMPEVLKGRLLTDVAPAMTHEFCVTSAVETELGSFAKRIVRFRAHDGQELQINVGCVGVHNLHGELESTFIICQDITETLRINRDMLESQRELLYTMGDVVDNRNHASGQHVRHVSLVSRFLAIQMGLDVDTAEMIEIAAPMHDIGKVGIRDAILNNVEKLSDSEFAEMKEHASIGHSILGKVERPLITLAATIAHQHHERFDGNGYPDGLKGEQIHIAARIVAIADVLDALLSSRAYKPAWVEARVKDYFLEQRGRQFDPSLVDILLEHWPHITALRKND